MNVLDISTSEVLAVTSTADVFTTELLPGNFYRYVATVGSFILQGSEPEATAASGSLYVPPNFEVTLDGDFGAVVSVIRAAGDGTACITRYV